MKPASFEYYRPQSVDEALSLLAEHAGDAKPLAGGQSLIPAMNFRLAMPAVLVETAFLSNPEEAKRLASPDFRQSVAEAIGRAVAAFVKLHPGEPSPSSTP